jgi:uncharacterized protein (UPF0548 family)
MGAEGKKVARWRFGRGWSEDELRTYLAELRDARPNFDERPERMTPEHGWTVDGADRVIGREAPGSPVLDGIFERAKQAIVNYDFSDPRIVVGHFDPNAPLLNRDMLLEIKSFGPRFLGGVRIHTVLDEADDEQTSFGFRYDTLEGHFERGFEWFLLSKRCTSGEVRFRIQAHWRMGDFPTWWSRVGFLVLGDASRVRWRRRAVARLRRLAYRPSEGPVAKSGRLAHRGDRTPIRRD